MVSRVFPRLGNFACFHLRFLLALKVFFRLLSGCCYYFAGFSFTTLNRNALYP